MSDLIACIDGSFVAVECKGEPDKNPTKKQEPTRQQQIFLNDIIKEGGIAVVAWDVEQVKRELRWNGLHLKGHR